MPEMIACPKFVGENPRNHMPTFSTAAPNEWFAIRRHRLLIYKSAQWSTRNQPTAATFDC